MTNKILIFTDGASRGNPGPGGWGAIIIEGHRVTELGGGEQKTTNNRMELAAAIGALEKTLPGKKDGDIGIKIFTDSGYLINGITKWIFGWEKNNWITSEKKDVLNKDLWQKLSRLVSERKIEWVQVKGHGKIAGNNRADEIATSFADDFISDENFINNKTKSLVSTDLFVGDLKNYNVKITEPTPDQMSADSERDRKNTRAYSYISLIDGKLETHDNWADCKARVNGSRGAKFRKTISAEDEKNIIKSWGL